MFLQEEEEAQVLALVLAAADTVPVVVDRLVSFSAHC